MKYYYPLLLGAALITLPQNSLASTAADHFDNNDYEEDNYQLNPTDANFMGHVLDKTTQEHLLLLLHLLLFQVGNRRCLQILVEML